MANRGPRAGLGLALVAGLLSACPLFEPSEDQTPEGRVAAVDPADYAEEVDAKLQRVSACRDVVASIMFESWERYTDQVDARGQPKRKREGVFIHGIGSNTFRSCRRVLEAAKLPPEMPRIEEQAEIIVETGSAYAKLTRELEIYLDDELWRDDDWAKLAQLDPELRAAHDSWQQADRALQLAIDLRHVENDPVLLGVLEARRSRLEVASRRVMIRARPLVRCMVPDDGVGSGDAPDALPSDEDCSPLFEAFDAAVAVFTDIYGEDREGADKVFWMTTFANDVEEFHALAAEFERQLSQRKPKLDVQGLLDGYSSLLRDAETLNFEFP